VRRLLFVVNVDWFFVSHRLPIALKAMDDGYDVHLACLFTDKKSQLQQLGITCHNVAFSRSGSSIKGEFNAITSLRRIIKINKVDVVHAITIKPVIYSGLALQAIKNPPAFVAAISGLGYVFTAESFRAKITKFLVSLMYKLAFRNERKVVIFQNTSDQTILSNIVKLSYTDSVLIKGSGADLSIYRYQEEPVGSKKIVSMACRLLKEKGTYEFIQAAKIIKEKHSEIDFWLIGNVDLDNPNSVSQKEIDTWVQNGIITAFGHRDDIPDLFAQSHVITMPSFYGEGVPKVLIEAAACGRAIVTTDNPGCRDAIIDKETGLLVPIKDAKALADALLDLLLDKDRRVSMGLKARKYAVSEFDVINVVKKHLETYESLLVNER
jgi:glycosyltransferase involved in cell wall biosynthesis